MKAAFDEYAGRYDSALDEGLSLSGESKEYFAQARVRWLAGRLRERGVAPQQVLDFGCGTGDTGPALLDRLHARLVVGVDPSLESIATARRTHADPRLQYEEMNTLQPSGQFQLAYCNGVFHHIESERRADALSYLHRSLSAGWILRLLGKQSVESGHASRDAAHPIRPRCSTAVAAGGSNAARACRDSRSSALIFCSSFRGPWPN